MTDANPTKFNKLVTLLKELFQLDQPDLDFGIYRIMHARADEVTQFLEKDLLPQVKSAFAQYQSADSAELKKRLEQMIAQLTEAGVDPEQAPKVRELREQMQGAVDIGALESEVYDHLYSFFRRYYSEGDFLSKRVYKAGVYAIPYEGEEVTLHWANKDQYYIKTSEYLRDYAFRLRPEPGPGENPMRVHFRLVDVAEGDHGNVKEAAGKERRFRLAAENFVAVEHGELVIRFTYAPDPEKQKDLNAAAEAAILQLADPSLTDWVQPLGATHVRDDGTESGFTRLGLHLDRYTKRNTFDYFIHKGLGTFLRRELDFYIKNEVMHLDDVEDASVPRVEQYLSKIKVIRRIAQKIVDFLAQLENFQKKLWLKKKFVVETSWCITLAQVPEHFYPEICVNQAQREEWIQLCAIDRMEATQADLLKVGGQCYSSPLTPAFLKAFPTLMVDTRFFDEGFTARLLNELADVDSKITGVLFHSENYQALSVLRRRGEGTVTAVYIDPPYNAPASEVLYKNDYLHSSWLSLMQDRLVLSKTLLSEAGCYSVAIDDYELTRLCELLEQTFPNFDAHTVVVNHHPQGGMSNNLTRTHEYMVTLTPVGKDILRGKKKVTEVEYRSFMLAGPGDNKSRSGRPNSFYAVLIDESKKRIMGFEPPPMGSKYPTGPTKDGFVRRYPINEAGDEKVWCRAYTSASECLANGEMTITDTGSLKLVVDTRNARHSLMSNWTDTRYNAGPHGTGLLADIIGDREAFPYPKSIHTVRDALEAMTWHVDSPLVIDFFGGSGTTGHAIINLNREDGGQRKFILVEQANYFDTVLLPRLKKVTFSPDWTRGKPNRFATAEEADRGPSIMKVIRLETYEDALNNIAVERSEKQQSLLDSPEAKRSDGFAERYILRYVLDVETRGSPSLLNVSAFVSPTAYKLKIKRPGSDESREVNVDLLETFNWLLGLTVRHIAAPRSFTAKFRRDSEGRLGVDGRLKQDADGPWWFRTVTGTTPEGRKTLVIWRKLTDDAEQDNLVLETWFRDKQAYSVRDTEFDLIYVNGDSTLENIRVDDEHWKVRLIEEDFHRLMFDVSDA